MLSHSASSLSSKEYTHPNHGQPVSPEDAVGNSVKSLTEVQVQNIHSLSLIHYAGHLVTEGDQVGQEGLTFHEPMLAGPDPLVVMHMLDECAPDEPLHSLPWCRGQADRPLVPEGILLFLYRTFNENFN